MPTTYLESFGADLSENELCQCVSILLTGTSTLMMSFRPMPMAWRSLGSAVPPAWVTARQGQAPWTPQYTFLIPVSVHMFHPDPQVHFKF